ncbi:PTS sugar transporter subunit IIC [Dubosiella newyorkensis]|uniref:PTS sugar transporter subunit IIC n=1 Tax=Dubosiella newyorkensis TaxID=1862672 RepID=UPI0025726595|nr:PTS transporter subunit EIIC [Dubosiella newyorkensis]
MNALMNWMEQHLVPIANRFAQNPILKTMSEGAMSLLAVIMVGSIFSILNGIPWEPYTNFLNSTHLNEFFAFIPANTTELLGLYMAFSVGRAGAKNFGQPESAFMCGILSMACYLVLVPIDSVEGVSSIQTKYLGTQGIFVALIGGILSSSIVTWIIQKKIVIKMPSGVPPMVGENFAALIPGFVIITLFALIKWIFLLTPYGNPIDCIYSIIQTPLQALTSSLPAFLLLILIAQILWFFGVHGSYSVLPILFPLWIGYAGENTANAAAGLPIEHILNAGMWDLACLGGAGATIGLVIWLCFFSKSAQYKDFGRLTFPCGVFGVNEPAIFGLPIMLNPIMFIPFVITPVVIVSLAYFLISIGLITPPVGLIGAGSIPPFLHGLANGSLSFAIYELIAIGISMIIYYPFFKLIDKQALLKEEQGEKNE